MKKEDIPQDEMLFEGQRVAHYAVAEDGTYILGKCAGWDAVNVANAQAWEFIAQQVSGVRKEVLAGGKSILAFHMVRYQMDVALLAKYVGLSKWRVRRHLLPAVFSRLKPKLIERYAAVFQKSVDEFLKLPKSDDLLANK